MTSPTTVPIRGSFITFFFTAPSLMKSFLLAFCYSISFFTFVLQRLTTFVSCLNDSLEYEENQETGKLMKWDSQVCDVLIHGRVVIISRQYRVKLLANEETTTSKITKGNS
jgi:hypothetical protein